MQEFGLSLNIGSGTVQYGHIVFPLLDDGVEGIQVKRIEHTTIPKWSNLSVNRYHKRDKLKWTKLEGQLHPRRAEIETSTNHCCGYTGSYKESVGGGSAVHDHNDKSDASSFQDKESCTLFNDKRRPEKKTLDEETRGVTYKQSETIAFDVLDMSASMGMTKSDNVGSVSNTTVWLPVLTADRNLIRTVRAAPRMNNANTRKTINRSGLDKRV
uniref:Uncharacterized protein n=1 Tax=Biomphalaria glabrata TaxID=6526 RepID=A0A2C9KXC0_BIOGL